MSKVQVLVATMDQTDFSKYDQMKLHTDAIFANQSDCTSFEEKDINGSCVKMITTKTRGVGTNRNLALCYASGDILVMADDDMIYVNSYDKIIEDAFHKLPNADCIIFNIKTIGAKTGRRKNTKIKRVHFYNALNYGAARIAVKRKSIVREGITFNTNFGGGCRYSAGEDVLFVTDMLKRGLKLYTYPKVIGAVDQSTSTWFEGFNEKFFYDKGALMSMVSKTLSMFLCEQFILRHNEICRLSGISKNKIRTLMRAGIKNVKELRCYEEYNNKGM